VPFVHVGDVPRSAAFYARFGFEVRHTHEARGRRVWCWLERNPGRLMLAEASEPGAPGPDREFGMLDPDGYRVMVTDAEAHVPPG
jgi:hypothetical protein